jgi:hypothetical protein
VKELGELWMEKDPRLSLAHLCICTGGKVLIAGAHVPVRRGYLLSPANKFCIHQG